MSYDGSGGYAPPAPHYPAIPGTKIAAEDFNTIIQDIADALSRALIRDGQAKVEGNIDVNGFKLLRAKLDETSVGKTLPPGTDTDQLATMKALKEASFNANLPSQAGNAGKLVSTDGFSAFWTNLLQGVTLAAVKGTAVVESIADAYTINPAAGNLFNLTLTGNTSLSFAAQPVGEVFSAKVILRQDETGGRTATWPENISWLYTAPSLNPTPWGVDTFELLTTDGGITWLGAHTSPESLLHNYGDQAVRGVKDFFDKANFRDGLTTDSLNGGPLAGMRNLLRNGNMLINQRNPGVVTTDFKFIVDGWSSSLSGSVSVNFGVAGDNPSVTGGQGIFVQCGATKPTLAAPDVAGVMQRIEGYNVADLALGTANAKQFTVSFRARASVATTIAIAARNGASSRSYVANVALSEGVGNYSVTIPGDTSGAWAKDNTTGLQLSFVAAAGSNWQTSSNAWVAGNFLGTPQTSNILDTAARFVTITDVQLEPGSVATPFERRPPALEEMLCRRYCRPMPNLVVMQAYAASAAYGCIELGIPMRANPTLSTTAGFVVTAAGGGDISATPVIGSLFGGSMIRVDATAASGLVAGNATALRAGPGAFLLAEL